MQRRSTLNSRTMANLTIRRIDPTVKERLRLRAAANGRSMEEEARRILSNAIGDTPAEPNNAFDWLRAPVAELGGIDLILAPRSPGRPPPVFD